MNSFTGSAKTIMYLEIMFACETYRRLLEHNHIVEELEQLIGEAYRSGDEAMEKRYRNCLALLETGYDL